MLTHGRRRKKINVCRWQESKPSFNLLLSVFVVSGSYVQRARAVDFLDRLIFWGQKKITGLFFLPRSNHYFYACSEYQKKDECPKKRSVSWTELFSGASNFLSLSLPGSSLYETMMDIATVLEKPSIAGSSSAFVLCGTMQFLVKWVRWRSGSHTSQEKMSKLWYWKSEKKRERGHYFNACLVWELKRERERKELRLLIWMSRSIEKRRKRKERARRRMEGEGKKFSN